MKKITNTTINQAKNIVERLFETSINPVEFCRKVEHWYCNSKGVSRQLRLAVLATAIVTGGDMSESPYYYKPTTEAVRQMLPIVEEKMRKHAPLKIMCAEWSRYVHYLFTDRFYDAYTDDLNVYHIDIHFDSDGKEVA